jgi:leucyl aminopeptidase
MEMLAIPVCEDAGIHDKPTLKKLISSAKSLPEFSGKIKQQVILYEPTGTKIKRCLYMGVGTKKKNDAEILRSFAGRSVNAAINAKLKKIVIAVPSADKIGMEPLEVIHAVAEGAFLANHIFDKYKEKSKKTPLKLKFLI